MSTSTQFTRYTKLAFACNQCAKEFPLIDGRSAPGFTSSHGEFCSQACETIYRLDMRGSIAKAIKLLRYGGYTKAAARLENEFADYQDAIWGSGAVKDILHDAIG